MRVENEKFAIFELINDKYILTNQGETNSEGGWVIDMLTDITIMFKNDIVIESENDFQLITEICKNGKLEVKLRRK